MWAVKTCNEVGRRGFGWRTSFHALYLLLELKACFSHLEIYFGQVQGNFEVSYTLAPTSWPYVPSSPSLTHLQCQICKGTV
jgi:hypothetical protein